MLRDYADATFSTPHAMLFSMLYALFFIATCADGAMLMMPLLAVTLLMMSPLR